MSIVYVIQESPGKNVLSALEYGEIKFLLPANRQLMLSPGQVVNELHYNLSNFTEEDYLLLIGDPAAMGVACAFASEWNRGRFKLLKWDKQTSKYYPIQIDLHSKQ
jgi:hypothetical protein